MPTITFTVDGPAGKGGTARFEPRAMFEADGKLVTSWASPRLVKYTNNTAVSVVLPEGPWKVGGLSGGQPLPIDVGSVNADLKDLIVFNLPPSAPATTLSQAVAAWMDSNVNTEVTDTLMSELLADEGSDAVAAVDARVAAGTAGLLSEAVAENTYVRSVNGVPVDPATGDVEIEVGGGPGISLVDNGDGTFTIDDPTDTALVVHGDGTFTLTV